MVFWLDTRESTIHEKPDRTDSVDFSQSSCTDPIQYSLLIGRVPRIDNSMLV